MGNGIKLWCKDCGERWCHLLGEGFLGKPTNPDDTTDVVSPDSKNVRILKCPKCNSINIVQTESFLWD